MKKKRIDLNYTEMKAICGQDNIVCSNCPLFSGVIGCLRHNRRKVVELINWIKKEIEVPE